MQGLAILAALFTVVAWSLNFPFIRYVSQWFSAGEITALRIWFASLFMGLLALRGLPRRPRGRDGAWLLLIGVLGAGLSSYFLTLGLRTVTSGAGALVIATVPVFSAVLARVFLMERILPGGWAGIAVSTLGVALIGLGEGGGARLEIGALLLVGSALCQAVYYVFQKPLNRGLTAVEMNSWAMWGSALPVALLAPDVADSVAAAPWSALLGCVYLGVVPLGLGFITWSYALARAPAAQVTSAMYTMPLLTTLEAWAWLGELPAPLSLLGGALALAGVILLHLLRR